MTTDLTITRDTALSTAIERAGQRANEAAACAVFADYRSRKATNTLRRQDAALGLFSEYLGQTIGIAPTGESLALDAGAWTGITWGLVKGFAAWLPTQGYSVGTINVRLSTIKTYAKLAAEAGAMTTENLALILTTKGYSRAEGVRFDEKRMAADVPTRSGHKKRDPVTLTRWQIEALREIPDPTTAQGRRDRLLLSILLDLGLRCGELASLTVGAVNLEARELTFYRQKVDKVQTMDLTITPELWQAVSEYLDRDALAVGPLLRASRRDGTLTGAGMSNRAITARVRYLGGLVGIEGLSAHDLRHTWATWAARSGTLVDRLKEAGGWASPAMPLRYVEAARIANEGVILEGHK